MVRKHRKVKEAKEVKEVKEIGEVHANPLVNNLLLNKKAQLDQLDKALDAMEQKNDSIHDQLRELLEDSKQARLELEAEAAKQ